MLERTMQLRLVKQQVTKREEADYKRYNQETLQQLWTDSEGKIGEWRDVEIVEDSRDKSK